jgi:hypothetical protein
MMVRDKRQRGSRKQEREGGKPVEEGISIKRLTCVGFIEVNHVERLSREPLTEILKEVKEEIKEQTKKNKEILKEVTAKARALELEEKEEVKKSTCE